MGLLDGRVALVTGGSSGIGKTIATRYGEEGADVAVADVRREPKLSDQRSVFEHLNDVGAEHIFVEMDVTDEAEIGNAVDTTVGEFGDLDILVNNAGVYYQNKVHETPTEEMEAILNVNLRGLFAMCKAAMPALKKSQNGKIINLSSIFGVVGGANSAAYSASKGGVANLTRQMAIDYADDEINVNALAPGIIKTAQNVEWRRNNPDIVDEWEHNTPWPTFGDPEDVADAALFLASDRSDFVTGDVLSVDGGWTAR